MTKTRFLVLVTALVLLLTIPMTAFAQNAKPHAFVGSATLDGAVSAEGTVVTAWVDGAEVATGTVNANEDGVLSYLVQVESADGYAGKTVSFQVGGVDADQTFDWKDGEGTILDLTATSAGGGDETAAAPAAAAEPAPTAPPGPPGSKGDKGDTGAAGAAGAKGDTGGSGSAGAAGTKGDTGATGSAGAGTAGAAGADGDDGSSVLGIIAIILAAVAIVGAGGAYMMGRRT